MIEYEGKKWRPDNRKSYKVRNEEYDWGYDVPKYSNKQGFTMTKQYLEYIKEQRDIKRQNYIKTLISKCKWQEEHYGEVDTIDFEELQAYLQNRI